MSFNVTFYNFNKHYNSTKRPGASDSEKKVYSCNILRGSSIYNPKIELDIGLTSTPARYNYCVIPAFDSRYYFVKEWTFSDGLWIANLQEDVLASWKTTIGHTSRYILRAANAFDGNVIDNKYPCKTNCDYVHESITAPYIVAGTYILGCVSKNGDYGSIIYYALDTSEIRTLCHYLTADAIKDPVNGYTTDDASYALQNSLVDPVQYIKSCVFIPYSRNDLVVTQTQTVSVFNWDVPNITGYILNNNRNRKTFSIPITKHPDTQSRGNYVNAAPYTLLTLYFPPFGVIEIDTSVTCTATTLDLILDTDLLTGKGLLTIKANGVVLNKVEAMIGVPIQLSQVTRDYIGAVTSIANGVTGAIAGIAAGGAGGIAGAVGAGISGIGNAIQAMAPRAQTIGSNGGFAALAGAAQLDHQFFRPVEDDPTNNGRPLCQFRAPENIGGFMIIQDGSIEGATTFMEGEEIRRLLETGFYFE